MQRISHQITTGRMISAGYAALVLVIAFYVIPNAASHVHYLATRYLGTNTRLASSLLVAPGKISLEDRLRLARERSELEGRYLKQPVDGGDAITPDKVSGWPDVNGEEVTPVEIDTEPDWMIMNQGTQVELSVGDKAQPEYAHVLAIVPSGNKWLALLQKKDLGPTSFGAPKEKRTLRIWVLPEKPAQLIPEKSMGPRNPQSPARESPSDKDAVPKKSEVRDKKQK